MYKAPATALLGGGVVLVTLGVSASPSLGSTFPASLPAHPPTKGGIDADRRSGAMHYRTGRTVARIKGDHLEGVPPCFTTH